MGNHSLMTPRGIMPQSRRPGRPKLNSAMLVGMGSSVPLLPLLPREAGRGRSSSKASNALAKVPSAPSGSLSASSSSSSASSGYSKASSPRNSDRYVRGICGFSGAKSIIGPRGPMARPDEASAHESPSQSEGSSLDSSADSPVSVEKRFSSVGDRVVVLVLSRRSRL